MIRTYQSGDEGKIVALWNIACPQDPITVSIFTRQVLVDPNFAPEGLIIAEEAGEVIGGTICIVRRLPLNGTDLEPENGWITAMFVHPSKQYRGVGTAMLKGAEEFFKNAGRQRVYFASYAPNYFVPGVDPNAYVGGRGFLEKMGFEVLDSPVAMDKNLVGYTIPKDVQDIVRKRTDEGYVFEFLTPSYVTSLIQFVQRQFNPDWTRAIRDFLHQGGSLDHILIARWNQNVVGFCMYGAYGTVGERFGPFGVDDSLRGTGLGKILLYQCLQVMRSQGLHNAWFLWTGETDAAGYLYHRAGFTVTRSFDVMVKQLG